MSTTKEGYYMENPPRDVEIIWDGLISGHGHCTLIYASTNHAITVLFLLPLRLQELVAQVKAKKQQSS